MAKKKRPFTLWEQLDRNFAKYTVLSTFREVELRRWKRSKEGDKLEECEVKT